MPVNIDELVSALTENTADPVNVRAVYARKRRQSVRRRFAAIAGITTVVLAGGALTAIRPWVAAPQITVTGLSCAHLPLRSRLIDALRHGESVIVAYGKLAEPNHPTDGSEYSEMHLRDVRTLAGPHLHPSTTAWVYDRVNRSEDTGVLLAPDGHLFAIAWPGGVVASRVAGTILTVAPIVNEQVIFSRAGCWNTVGLRTRPYHGSLKQIPGSQSYQRTEDTGFWAVPLSTVESTVAAAEREAAGGQG